MAIIGEDLPQKLQNQIQVRQKKLGKTLLDTEDIIFANSNTSWIRAASSVNIVNNDVNAASLQNLGIVGNNGDYAARNGVLFGGVSNTNGTIPFEAFTKANTLEEQITGHYGWGGNSEEWGFSPPPTLQSLTIKALNRGAIRKAELSILAHNPDQFRILDALYMRLGFTILVEWGHSIYYNNEGELETSPNYNTKAFDAFIGDPITETEENSKSTFNRINDYIEEEKVLRDFNYGGFIGYISNYNWKFNSDGTYAINVSVITKGGLIDSLTLNHPSVSQKSSRQGHSHTLSNVLDEWKQQANSGSLSLGTNNNVSYNAASDYEEYNSQQGETFKDLFSKDGEILHIVFNNNTPQTYCTLGLLLKVIEQRCLFYDKNSSPIINIDNKYENSYMLTHPFQASLDPGVCVIPSEIPNVSVTKTTKENGSETNRIYSIRAQSILGEIENSFRTDSPFKADIMGILVNLDYITNTFNNSLQSGNVSLNKFLSNLLDGINSSLGSLNEFHLSYDDTSNTYSIYDDTTIPGLETNKKATGKINIYSRKSKKESSRTDLGSFVKDVSISSKIFPNIQNLVAIAAQNPQEGTIGEKVGSFQRLNKGLVDRTSDGGFVPFETKEVVENQSPYSKYTQIIYNVASHLINVYTKFKYPESSNVSDLKSSYPKVLIGDLQWRGKENQITPPFFMPLEISLTMHGLSGFKLFQKFDVGPDFIFPSYIPDNLNYIIQGITHDLKNNEWTTTLNTLCWMADNPTYSESSSTLELPIVGTPESVPDPTPGNEGDSSTPNANRLRTVLNTLNFREKGQELANGGDITSEMADYAISVFTTIKAQTNVKVTVTGGNDIFHQNLPYRSRHASGRGIDFVISPRTPENLSKVENILKGYAAGNYSVARFLNEYDDPSKAATGDHFHLSYGEGDEALSVVNAAKAQAEAGTIPTYKIT